MARLTDISKMKICKSTEIQSAGGGFGMLKILSGETPVQQEAAASHRVGVVGRSSLQTTV